MSNSKVSKILSFDTVMAANARQPSSILLQGKNWHFSNLISGHCGLFCGIPLKAWGAKLIEPWSPPQINSRKVANQTINAASADSAT
jgi:hypothetical protein